jgi:hypothetical protein
MTLRSMSQKADHHIDLAKAQVQYRQFCLFLIVDPLWVLSQTTECMVVLRSAGLERY